MHSSRSEPGRSGAKRPLQWMLVVVALLGLAADTAVASETALVEREYVMAPPAPKSQSQDAAREKSSGCISCHRETDEHTMHANPAVVLGCTDCHGVPRSCIRPEAIGIH